MKPTNLKELDTIEQFNTVMDNMTKPSYLFKHSTTCPISSRAMSNVERFMQEHPNFSVYRVLVIESRSLSNHISEVFKVIHQSPQIYLINNKKCLWNASHMAVNEQSMKEKLQELVPQ